VARPVAVGRTWTAMSLMRRLVTLFRAKANKALDRAEDPREILDYSCERQPQQSSSKLQGQAQQALAAAARTWPARR
jgi:phage shock protein A